MMQIAGAIGGSPLSAPVGPPITTNLAEVTVSGDSTTFDWTPPSGLEIASGEVIIRTDQGALVGQYPFPINVYILVSPATYYFTWTGTYTDGSTFSTTGSTTVLDYSLPENAEQVGVAQHELQYPVFATTGIPVMPEDVNVAFEDLSFTQRVFWSRPRSWNEPNYVVEMRADMLIMANDFNYNTATRNRSAVNAAFLLEVGNLGAIDTLRSFVNWHLHVEDGNSISYWPGWHGGWLDILEWWDTIVPESRKVSLVDPSLAFS